MREPDSLAVELEHACVDRGCERAPVAVARCDDLVDAGERQRGDCIRSGNCPGRMREPLAQQAREIRRNREPARCRSLP